jgi:hypothetical protein
MQNQVLTVLLQWSFVYLIRVSVSATSWLDRNLTSQKRISCSALHARPVEGDHAIRIQPDILDLPAAQNCGAMEGEPPKVFTVSGQCEEVARDDNRLLHHPRRQAPQNRCPIENSGTENGTRAMPEGPPLLMGASYGPRPPIADPKHAKVARGGNRFSLSPFQLTQPKP